MIRIIFVAAPAISFLFIMAIETISDNSANPPNVRNENA